jgi:hypothetical protein
MALSLTTTTVSEVQLRPALKSKLLKRLRVYAELRAQLKAIESAMDKEKSEIGLLREEAGVNSLKIEGFSVSQVTSTRKKFYLERLLAMGVTTAMWDECHDPVPGKPYLKVACPGEKDYSGE